MGEDRVFSTVEIQNMQHSFNFKNTQDFLFSLFPSLKYKATAQVIAMAPIITSIGELMGMKSMVVIAFVVLCFLELVTGIYASVVVRNEKFQTVKASRFTIKLACICVILFSLYQFSIGYKDTNQLVSGLFEWLYLAVLCYFAIEYLISVIEHMAVVDGKSENTTLVSALKKKLNRFLDLDGEPSDTTTTE